MRSLFSLAQFNFLAWKYILATQVSRPASRSLVTPHLSPHCAKHKSWLVCVCVQSFLPFRVADEHRVLLLCELITWPYRASSARQAADAKTINLSVQEFFSRGRRTGRSLGWDSPVWWDHAPPLASCTVNFNLITSLCRRRLRYDCILSNHAALEHTSK